MIGCAVAVLSLYVLYVAALNVFLSTSLFEKVLDGDPETLFISFERGWSVWPGHVQARHLTIRSSDSHVQWVLRIDRCAFDVSFFDLAVHKKFHVTHVDGTGVSFQARQRVPSPEATPAYVDALPPIPGFPRIPLPTGSPPNLLEKWNDRYYHLWRVELEDVTANDVREVWIDSVRFEGSARVKGGFRLIPIREAFVAPSHVDVAFGRVTVKDRVVADPVAGAIDVTLASFDPRTIGGDELLHRVTVGTDLHGRVPDLANVPRTLIAPVVLTGPADVRRLAVRIDHGVLAAPSHVDVALRGAAIEVAKHRLAGDLAVFADITSASTFAPKQGAGPASAAKLTFHVDARALTATRTDPRDRAVLFRAAVLDVSGDARALDLAAPLSDLHAVALLESGDMPDARVLASYIAPDASLGFMGGKGNVHGRVETWLDRRRLKARAGLQADDLDLRIAKTRLLGSTAVDLSFEDWRWDLEHLDGLVAKVHVAQGSIARNNAPEEHLVDVKGFEIGIDAPEVDLQDPLSALQARIDMPDSEIVDRGLLRKYLPRGKEMRVAKGYARFDLQCAVDVKDHLGAGTLDIHAKHLGLTLEDLDFFTNVTAHARVHDWKWESGDLALDKARVELTALSSTKHGSARPAATVASLLIDARSDAFSFSDPFQRIDIDGHIKGGRVADPITLDAFLSKSPTTHFDVAETGARFDVDVRAKVDGSVARGRLTVHGHGLGARTASLRVVGDLDAFADVTEWQIDESKLRVAGAKIIADNVVAELGASRAADVRLHHLELEAKIAELDFSNPSWRGIDYRLLVDEARIDDATRLNALFAGSGAGAAGQSPSIVIESGQARASVDITVRGTQGTAKGVARLAIDHAGIRKDETQLGGDVVFEGVVKGFDRDRDVFDIAGSRIALRGLRVTGANAETSAWNGDLSLASGALRLSKEPAFDGFVQVHADDASPILALALAKSLPKFVVGLMKAPDLSGQTRVVLEPGRQALLDARLRGGDVVAFGDLVVRGDHELGAFVVAKGRLSAGVKVDDRGTYVRFFDLDGWHADEKRAALALFNRPDANAKPSAKANAAPPSPNAKPDAKPDAAKAKPAQPRP